MEGMHLVGCELFTRSKRIFAYFYNNVKGNSMDMIVNRNCFLGMQHEGKPYVKASYTTNPSFSNNTDFVQT